MVSVIAFQQLQQLSQKKSISRERTAAEDKTTFLCVGIHEKQVYINTDDITEVMPYAGASPVGHTVPWYKGLIKVQGEICSLVDIASFLEQPPVGRKDSYVIALSRRHDNIAILVENLAGLHAVKMTGEITKKGYTDVYQTEKGEVQVLSFARLFSSDDFFNISVFK